MEWIEAKTIVTRNKVMNWDYLAAEYNMNIYHGCNHGCIYCYARGDYYGIDNFDTVKAKKNALQIIRDDLQRKVKTGIITTGGMADPYNICEKNLRLTRNSLELINAFSFGICVLTKSTLVTRDVDILSDIKMHSPVSVNLSITCHSDELSRRLEPHAPQSSERFQAIAALSKAGITTGVLLDPVIPYLTDNETNIRNIVRKAKAAGAKYLYFSPRVTMEGHQRDYFFSKAKAIRADIPELYKKAFHDYYYCKTPNRQKLGKAFIDECEKQNIIYDMKAANHLIRDGYYSTLVQWNFT